jgi:hypothetical protein
VKRLLDIGMRDYMRYKQRRCYLQHYMRHSTTLEAPGYREQRYKEVNRERCIAEV